MWNGFPGKANEITKDSSTSTNVYVEDNLVKAIAKPEEFQEKIEVAKIEVGSLKGTVTKTIENTMVGDKSQDKGDPETRTLKEIKESVIRAQTAPEIETIATKDLTDPNIQTELGVTIEKFDPNSPNISPKVRERIEELKANGKTIVAFYDNSTGKIFLNETAKEEEIRPAIAREWKIREDLRDGKGKLNAEGKARATVAGEIAYNEVLGRVEKKPADTVNINNLANATMNPDSEVTADYISREDLEFRKNQREVVYFTEARRAQIFDGTTDVVVGGGTAVASGSVLATSVGADYVTVGTTVVPSMPVKVVAATGVVVGTNKFVTGLGKVWNGFYGSEVGKTPNPIRDRIPTKYQDMYDAAEIVLEVGIAHTAPHVVGMNKNSNTNILQNNYPTNGEKYISNPEIPYDGVKKASKHLKNIGIERKNRKNILNSFDIETIQVEKAGINQYGIRFYDIDYKTKITPAYPNGQYLFETFTPYVNRENLALPFSWNEMTGIKQFQIKPGTIIFTGKAAPQFQQGDHYIGGAPQIFVNQPWKYKTLLEPKP